MPGFAQSIIPAADGTATIVTQDGERYIIDGGTLSGDGANLFHSFQELGLSANEIATFLSDPTIQNILSRVIGGDPSIIDGLLQVSGGNSNLFLMNPAGIVFGPNARLDLSGSFSATTATGIEFAEGWFDAIEAGDFTTLTGNPIAYRFGVGEPGAIVNAGTLAVEPGQGVSLVGGTVINTGTIEAPGGQITVTAVPGTSRVRLQQPGWVVALEVDVALLAESGASAIAPWDLPRLLTEGAPGIETGLVLAADGSVQLAESGVMVPSGGATSIVSGQLDAANRASGQTGGEIAVLGDRVGLVGAEVDASGDAGGGRVLVGGEFQGNGMLPNAERTYISEDSSIQADGGTTGDGGEVIVWADEVTRFYGGISAQGGNESGNGGFVEVSGAETLTFRGEVNTSAPNGEAGTLLLDPENIVIVDGAGTDDGQIIDGEILAGDGPSDTFTISEIALENLGSDTNVILEATNDITINDLTDDALAFSEGPGGSIIFNAGNDFIMLDIEGDSVFAGGILGEGDQIVAFDRNISISAGGDVIIGTINTLTPSAFPSTNDAGSINVSSENGSIAVNILDSRSPDGSGGEISLDAFGDITVNNAIFSLGVFDGVGGDVTITSRAGQISIPRLNTRGSASAGNIFVSALGDIAIDDTAAAPANASADNVGGNVEIFSEEGNIFIPDGISSSSSNGDAGDISIIGLNGFINIDTGEINSSSLNGEGGNILIQALGNITTSDVTSRIPVEDNNGLPNLGTGTAGDITIRSLAGSIDTTNQTNFAGIDARSNSGQGGNIILEAAGDIRTADVASWISITNNGSGTAGDILIRSLNGAVDTTAQVNDGVLANSNNGTAGSLTIEAAGDVRTGDIGASIADTNNGSGFAGTVTVRSANGSIDTRAGNVAARSQNGTAGSVTLEAENGSVFTSDIDVDGLTGGDLRIIAETAITTLELDTSGSTGSGGNVFLDPLEDVEVSFIDAQGGLAGVGGEVDITTGRFFRATGTFIDQNGIEASISSAGGQGGGPITIRHGGGLQGTSFDVGDATVNGTAGAITSAADNVIAPTQSFPTSYTQGNIRILTPSPNVVETQTQPAIPEVTDPESPAAKLVAQIETVLTSDVQTYFGRTGEDTPIKTLSVIQSELNRVEAQTGSVKPAVIYAFFVNSQIDTERLAEIVNKNPQPSGQVEESPDIQWRYSSDRQGTAYSTISPYVSQAEEVSEKLVLMVITADGPPKLFPTEVTFEQIDSAVQNLNAQLSQDFGSDRWEPHARSMHNYLIEPIETMLEDQGINNLLFVMDANLRHLPLAAFLPGNDNDDAISDLQSDAEIASRLRSTPLSLLKSADGRYLIEDYSVGLVPSMSLTDTRYRDVSQDPFLAMGTDDFSQSEDRLSALKGARTEIEFLETIWRGEVEVPDQAEFTIGNLQSLLQQQDFRIVHLATHAQFKDSEAHNSYIHFAGTERLFLDELPTTLDLHDIELLTLSACETALGDREAELGFAGLAYQAGAKSALASLVQVSDVGTAALMAQFYTNLSNAPIKAEALREAQLAMLNRRVYVQEGHIYGEGLEAGFPLQEPLTASSYQSFEHPYYWAWFTVVGSPW
ncbi:CHAT domain-containing protein [Halomicronema hongdechloris]|uniref:CHAT domain-containing protein n=1 Tax=Halomicronema hongdechloris TaxID=1209493 RepID=UPI001651468A|nr:CHAT domain-containing protein [Halomicronema hongdechloris]